MASVPFFSSDQYAPRCPAFGNRQPMPIIASGVLAVAKRSPRRSVESVQQLFEDLARLRPHRGPFLGQLDALAAQQVKALAKGGAVQQVQSDAHHIAVL